MYLKYFLKIIYNTFSALNIFEIRYKIYKYIYLLHHKNTTKILNENKLNNVTS